MPTVDRDGLREALARTLAIQDGWQNPDALWTDNIGLISRGCEGNPVYQDYLEEVDALIAGPLAPILAQAETAAQAVADRDEARTAVERLSFTDETGATWRPVPGWAYMALHKRATAAQAEAARLSAENDRLRERLEIKWAYDGAGNRIPFPEGMDRLDGIECRDETIKGLEERCARLSAEVEALRATNRDLHRRTQKAERFRARHNGSFIYLIKRRLAESRVRRAAEAEVARLIAEVAALRAERDGARQEADNLREGLATLIAEQVRDQRTALASS